MRGRLPSLCLPLQMQPENFLHFTPDMQWVLSRSPGPRNLYNLSTNQAQALKAFAFPHLTLQFQDESLPEKPCCLGMRNSLTLAERTQRHKYVLRRNTREATKVFPQGKASHWIPRTARKRKSQDEQKSTEAGTIATPVAAALPAVARKGSKTKCWGAETRSGGDKK